MDHPGIQAQAAHPRRIPVDTQVEGVPGHAVGVIAVVRAAFGTGQRGVVERGAGHQAQAADRFAVGRQFQAAIALFAVKAVDVGGRIRHGVGARDLEDRDAADDLAPIGLDAGLVLAGLVGRENLSGIGGGDGGNAAPGQARGEVAVHGHVGHGLEYDARHRRDGAFVIGRVVFTGGGGVVVQRYALLAQAGGDQKTVIGERQGIRQRVAGQFRFRGLFGRGALGRDFGQRRRAKDVGRDRGARSHVGVAGFLVQARGAQRQRMPDSPGVKARAYADVARPGTRVRVVIGIRYREVAQLIRRARRECLACGAVAVAGGAVDSEVVVDVVLEPRGDGRVVKLEAGARVEVAAARGRRRQRRRRWLEADLGPEIVGVLVLGVGVQRPAQRRCAVVQGHRAQALLLPAVVDGRVAVAVDAVEPDAPFLVCAPAAAHVELAAELCLALVRGGQAGQGFVACALGHHVDAAADAAAGADAVHQRARSLQDFHAFDDGRVHPAGRGQAIQAIQADVAAGHHKASDLEVFAEAAA
ncbi:hypothetical protein D3C86_1016080 [compost metagenome]